MTKPKNPFDADFAREMFDYNPETGVITRKQCRISRLIGEEIGRIQRDGYIHVEFGWWSRRYNLLAHRLGWLIYHGEWPKDQLDHINGIRHDNRLCNLREATQAQNNANTRMYKNNSSGYKNIKWEPDRKRYGVFIRYDNKLRRLGRFKTIEEAISVRNAKYEEIYGEFTRYE